MITELTRNIKVIRPEGKAIFPYSNSIYVDDDVKTVIDAGAGGRAYADIPVNEVGLLLLSHFHFDHVQGISFFPQARVMAAREEADCYRDADIYMQYSGYARWEELMGYRKIELFSEYMPMPDDVPIPLGFQPVEVAGCFNDGEEIVLGQTTVTAIHTPGHSPGHYSFYFAREGIMFSGDIDISPRGPWYATEFSDFDAFVKSVNKIIDLHPRILVTSHRRIFYEDVEKNLRDFLAIGLTKEEMIYEYLSEPRSVEDIALQDFAYDSQYRTSFHIFWTKMMIIKHLERLEKLGKIRKIETERYVRI